MHLPWDYIIPNMSTKCPTSIVFKEKNNVDGFSDIAGPIGLLQIILKLLLHCLREYNIDETSDGLLRAADEYRAWFPLLDRGGPANRMAIGWLCRFFSCLLPPPHRPPPLPTQWNSYIDGIERLFFRPGNASNKDLLTTTTTTAYWTIIRTEGGGLGEWGEGERAGWCEQDGDTEMRAPTANDDGNTRALWGIDTYPNEGSEAPNGSYDAMTGASIADTTTDLTHPTRPVRSNYRARRCRPPPRPSSPSPASPRAPRAPTSGHLPLFEWGNIAVRPVLPTDPTVTRHLPTTPPPTLYDIPLALQGSPLPRNLTTPVFNNGECN
ncbi:hypothetical protein EDD18DRAFT_1112597 [Armillaria luteobubalina]|uniref:Uncharacterized protein n=1 Tax=Armillaria luteobubalina TaxID=153913 RepID=A0AA39PEK9_9AGAR|nr:hypothetical protein EDD18DRAFT_1112597 [Armillaria luteobubalina]